MRGGEADKNPKADKEDQVPTLPSQTQQRRLLIEPAATCSVKCAENEAVDQMLVKRLLMTAGQR